MKQLTQRSAELVAEIESDNTDGKV
jgi:hypothetical protein